MERAPDRLREDPMTSTEPPRRLHPAFRALPRWPGKTVAVLATVAPSPHLIPVSAPVRGGDTRILISLRRDRGSLARLRARPAVALLVLAEGDIAFTAHGTAHILEEPMKVAEAYTAVEIDIDTIDVHRQPDFQITGGIEREWVNPLEQASLRQRVQALSEHAQTD